MLAEWPELGAAEWRDLGSVGGSACATDVGGHEDYGDRRGFPGFTVRG